MVFNLGPLLFPLKVTLKKVAVHYKFYEKVTLYFKSVIFSTLLRAPVTFCPPMTYLHVKKNISAKIFQVEAT